MRNTATRVDKKTPAAPPRGAPPAIDPPILRTAPGPVPRELEPEWYVREVPDPDVVYKHALIAKLEKRGRTGHSLDEDRTLMLDAALLLRQLLGLGTDDADLKHQPPSYYPPTENEPPIGHSLPDLKR